MQERPGFARRGFGEMNARARLVQEGRKLGAIGEVVDALLGEFFLELDDEIALRNLDRAVRKLLF